MSQAPANWYPDPHDVARLRWWDGTQWTQHVQHQVGHHGVVPQVEGDGSTHGAGPVPPWPRSEHNHEVASRKKIGIFGARTAARDLSIENEQLRAALEHVGALDLGTIQLETEVARQELSRVQSELSASHHELENLRAHLLDVRHAIDVQEFGLYDFANPAEASASLGAQLSAVRVEIRNCVSNKRATRATNNFTFNNSAAKGRTFINDMSKMMLAAYNAEAENAIKTVKAGGFNTAKARLEKAAERVAKNGRMIDLEISPEYHRLRILEVELAHRHLVAVQAAKEAERAHREELREAKRAEDELRREREKLDKERSHYVNALAALEGRGDESGAAELRAKLEEIDQKIDQVDYRAANVRAGYVYVISNVGSMGENIVKIGMTRRLDPMDRVRELSDASVPFNFDVHALFFSEDAFGIEAMLHRHFADRRVNRINLRREFFSATPAEVLDALREHNTALVEYQVEAAAEEYRASQAIARTAPR
jgi:FtsZ-binding cell division protein ZapB